MSKHTTEIIDETDLREIVICGQRAYTVQRDVAAEITRLQAINAELLAENKKLGRISAELKAACEAFLEAQDSPAPRDLLLLAAIKASNALREAA